MKNIEIYEKKILSYNDSNISTKYYLCDDCIEIVEKDKVCELTISINKNNHYIDSVKIYTLSDDKYIKGMMNAFCTIIIGLSILEANDHSLIKLENLLRDKNRVHNIKGIIMPSNCCSLFNIPLTLIRKVYDNYCKTQNYNPEGNSFISSNVEKWKKLDIKEKEKILSSKIYEFCSKNQIKNYDIKLIGDTRIEFFVDKRDYTHLGKLLFDMEVKIEEDLGFSLEVMYVEKQDTNRKRKK